METSQSYRVNITSNSPLPSNGITNPYMFQYYQLVAGRYLTGSGGAAGGADVKELLRIVDVFRDRVTRLIYSDMKQDLKFSLYPSSSSGTTNLALYKVKSIDGSSNDFKI